MESAHLIPKGSCDPELEFEARSEQARLFGHTVRSLHRIPNPPPLSLSFAEVVMAYDWEDGSDHPERCFESSSQQSGGWSRSPEGQRWEVELRHQL